MKKIINTLALTAIVMLGAGNLAKAQLTSLPSGGNKRASVSEQIGLTDVTINYSRPGVKGREGKIWGQLVPPGYVDQGFGPSKAAPWRAGANENTTIEFSSDVKIEGQPLAAGKYGFFIAYAPDECTLIFSKNSTSWGSFFYKDNEDALRVKVKPIPADKSIEWLKYEFIDQTPESATIALAWEKLVIPFKVETDAVKNQLTIFRNELRSEKGFTWEGWDQAAAYCAQHKTNLDEALLWTDTATSVNFGGSQSFQAWSTRARVLDSLGRTAEASATMKKALPFGTINDIYFYGRTLTKAKKGKEALQVFQANYNKYPKEFLAVAGMARGYSAVGDYKKALVYAKQAHDIAPGTVNKGITEKFITDLQAGKDIN